MLSVFNLSLIQQEELPSESYYELEPEKELTKEEVKVLEALEKLNNTKAETNKAFNETKNNKLFAQAYKPLDAPEDYVPDVKPTTDAYSTRDIKPIPPKIDKKLLSAFKKVNELLEEHKSDGSNTKSTISYSLVNRTHYYLPTPIYLCEEGGKIVINITVNDNGKVIKASVNPSSTSSNKCLIDHALEYAKTSRFNEEPSKLSQIGTITFKFIGKH